MVSSCTVWYTPICTWCATLDFTVLMCFVVAMKLKNDTSIVNVTKESRQHQVWRPHFKWKVTSSVHAQCTQSMQNHTSTHAVKSTDTDTPKSKLWKTLWLDTFEKCCDWITVWIFHTVCEGIVGQAIAPKLAVVTEFLLCLLSSFQPMCDAYCPSFPMFQCMNVIDWDRPLWS